MPHSLDELLVAVDESPESAAILVFVALSSERGIAIFVNSYDLPVEVWLLS